MKNVINYYSVFRKNLEAYNKFMKSIPLGKFQINVKNYIKYLKKIQEKYSMKIQISKTNSKKQRRVQC